MKHIYAFLLTAFVSFTANSYAQPEQRGPGKEISPKEIAEKKTEMLAVELTLTEKQRKKVYKLYFNEAKAAQSQDFSASHRPMGPPPGGGPGGRGGGEMMPPPNRGSFDGESGMPGAKREAKMRKILSNGQYDKWIDLEKRRKHKEFQDKLLRDAEKPLHD